MIDDRAFLAALVAKGQLQRVPVQGARAKAFVADIERRQRPVKNLAIRPKKKRKH